MIPYSFVCFKIRISFSFLIFIIKRCLFLISFLSFVLSHLGSEGLTLITLLGTCLEKLFSKYSVMLIAYLLMSASFKIS